MEKITFCIASAKNEKDYTTLLLDSLKRNTQLDNHEVLIFIDSDNQNTYEHLTGLRSVYPTLKIYRNTSGYPIGSQRNVSIMFNQASNPVVCYLQSDMVVGKDLDLHILNAISEDTVVSCTRIEPPLHPDSPEKITKDLGITPDTFKYDEFNLLVDKIQKERRSNTSGHFAPFAVYKSTWFDKLGGFDTQFRCSREDSDMIIRMVLCNIKTVQSWNACVYHFTCVSSRGTEWYNTKSEESQYKNELQQQADLQELKRFIRKWGYFGHEPMPFYSITFDIDIDRYVDFNVLKWLEPFCSKMYLSDSTVSYQLASQIQFESYYYSNLRWNFSTEHWNSIQHLYNPTDFHKKIKKANNKDALVGDIIISFKYSEFLKGFNEDLKSVIENINQVVDQNETGIFQYGPLTINIKQKNNLTPSKSKVLHTDLAINVQEFLFT
jgi:GT2 family glycosyltransferase